MTGNVLRRIVTVGLALTCAVVSGCGKDAKVAVTADSIAKNTQWAGFAVGVERRTDAVDEQIFFHEVSGRWIHPKVDCGLPGTFKRDRRTGHGFAPQFSIWVGFGGTDKFGPPAGALPQVGLRTGCTDAGSVPVQETEPWTEVYPKDANYDTTQWTVDSPDADRTVQPGDIVEARVVADGVERHQKVDGYTAFCTRRFRFELTVSPAASARTPFSLSASVTPPGLSDAMQPCKIRGEDGRPFAPQYLASAEWIVEPAPDFALPVGEPIEWLATHAKASVFRTYTGAAQVPQQHSGGEWSGPVNAAEWVVKRYEYHGRQGWATEDPDCAVERALLVPTPQLFRYVDADPQRQADDTTGGAFVVKNLAPPYCRAPEQR